MPRDREPAEGMPDYEKEQVKLRATYLNQIAGNLIIIGVFAPIAAVIYTQEEIVWNRAYMGFGAFFLTSGVLHIIAQVILRRIR